MTITASGGAPSPSRRPGGAPILACFLAASFLSAFLLFLLQPIIGKMILPRFGGVPAVWNTCQLFFQFSLLAGYGYAHISVVRLGVRRQCSLHLLLLLLPFASLPVALPAEVNWTGEGTPILPLLSLLALSVGLPFFVVSTTAPLLQRWYSETGLVSSQDPYFLYAASNLGSMVALIGYPLAVEPNLTLAQQGRLWALGFAALVVLIAPCGAVARSARCGGSSPAQGAATADPPCPVLRRTRLHWVALAFVPSSLLLGVTTHVTTDVAPIPLLWVVPLALYLLSFVLVFLRLPRWVASVSGSVMVLSLFALLVLDLGLWVSLGVHLIFFFSAAMVLHVELARRRPPAAQLTEFYLWMSVGGVLGGVANAILAPLLLSGFYEYRIAMVLACLLMPSPWSDERHPAGRRRLLPVALGLGFAALLLIQEVTPALTSQRLYRSRNFFGVLVVKSQPDSKAGYEVHKLVHGTTEHGIQALPGDREARRKPRAYYYPTGPIGQVFEANLRAGRTQPVAVIGLGAGSLASYAAEGQEFDFFEIDPDVVRVARDQRLFTFLTESAGRLRVVLGDARLTIAREPPRRFGLIVIDAFSSDAIPMHLLTGEALSTYLDKSADGGLIAFHVSNNYIDLMPVLDGLARAKGLHGLVRIDGGLAMAELLDWKRASHWVVLGRTREALGPLLDDSRWAPLPNSPDSPVWTDDYSSVLPVLKLRKR